VSFVLCEHDNATGMTIKYVDGPTLQKEFVIQDIVITGIKG
jgi:hypothetical protein